MEGRWRLDWVVASCEQVRRLYFSEVLEILESFQRSTTKVIRFGEWTLQHASPSDCLLASLATQQLCKWAGRASHSLRTAAISRL